MANTRAYQKGDICVITKAVDVNYVGSGNSRVFEVGDFVRVLYPEYDPTAALICSALGPIESHKRVFPGYLRLASPLELLRHRLEKQPTGNNIFALRYSESVDDNLHPMLPSGEQ